MDPSAPGYTKYSVVVEKARLVWWWRGHVQVGLWPGGTDGVIIVGIGGGVVADVAKSLGVTPIMASATKNYEMLSNGVADGTFLPMESIKSFKLTKLLKLMILF